MATLQSPGVGSGLDINTLVTQLMAAERAPKEGQLKRDTTAIATEISALGTLKGALSAFNSTLKSLSTVDVFNARSALSSDDEVFTATAASNSAPSTYNIRVNELAKAHQIASHTGFSAGSSSVIGAGSLTISLGSKAFGLEISAEKARLSDIRDAINSAADNPGVRAAIVNATDGAHLVLTSTKTGVANKIKVETPASGGLEQLAYDLSGNTANYDLKATASDSEILIAGFLHKSETNVVSDAIDGVTLTLKKKSPDDDVSLSIEANKDAAKTRIQNFVSQYNAARQQLADLGKYEAATGKSGPLIGDALLRSVTAEVRRGISDPVAGIKGELTSLSRIGITTDKTGNLTIDDSKLDAALASNFDSVGQLFGSENGIAARLSATISKRLEVTAEIASRNVSLDKRSKDVTKRGQELEVYLAKVEEKYRRQFSALDTAVARMQSTSSFLSQQLGAIANIGLNKKS
ncbi:MAG TPA: flagellar filament capping protein FliD [Steroidobacteraceae bacterium]|nr:flagellar filament capping protein FliD [Steroidobacteraceae bacterium]